MECALAVRDSELLKFFDEAARGFDHATERLGEISHEYLVAGRRARLRIAAPSLARLARPLAHLNCPADAAIEDETPLEILVWDGSTGWRPPAPPWDFRQLSWFGEIADLGSEEFAVNFTGGHNLLCMYHRPSRRALYWLPEARHLPYWETAAPFRIVFHWWAQEFGGQVAHAAAVGAGDEGLLLVGRGGSGKSTTSIACVEAGMEYVGDDYVLLTRTDGPVAHSLYHSAKIHTRFMHQALPHWSERVAGEIGPERKSLFFIHECSPEQVRSQLAIRGIVQPKLTRSPAACITPQPASAGLMAIAPSTMYQLPEARQATLSFFAAFARETPAYTLHLGADLASGPAELWKLLREERLSRAA